MKKALKYTSITIGALLLLFIGALLIIPFFIDLSTYRPMIEKKVTEATGRPFSMGPKIDLSLFPVAGIHMTDIRLGAGPGFKDPDFISVDTFEVRVKLMPLLSKEVEVKRFIVDRPRIVLIKDQQGRTNWQFATAPQNAQKPAAPAQTTPSDATAGLPIKDLKVGEFAITNGSLSYTDQSAGIQKEIKGMNLVLTNLSLDKAIGIALSAVADGRKIALDGTVGPLGRDPGKGTIAFSLVARALDQLTVKLNGAVTDPATALAYDVMMEIPDFSPRNLLRALDETLVPATRDPKVLGRLMLKTRLKGGLTHVALEGGLLRLDDSTLTFTASAKDFAKPDVACKANLDTIDLDRYLPPEQPAAARQAQPAPQAGQPAKPKPIDYGPLRKLVASADLAVGKLKAAGAMVSDIKLHATAKNGLIRIKPLALNLYDGSINVETLVNVQQKAPVTQIKLVTQHVQAGPLVRDVAQKDVIEGVMNATVDVKLAGDTPEAIKPSLNGAGELTFLDGAIVGIDIAGMVRNVGAAFGLAEKPAEKPHTDFAELKVPFTLTNGLFKTGGANLQSPLLRLIATGSADLVSEKLDMRVAPTLVATLKGQGDATPYSGITVPVLVTGTFKEPKFRPDLASGVAQGVKEKLLENENVKKVLEDENLKPVTQGAEMLLKGLFAPKK